MTLTQGNTIDFDSARLKLSQASKTAALPERPATAPSLHAVQQQLVMQLQTTLELEQVLEMFFRQLNRFLGLDSLEYRNEAQKIQLRIGQLSLHRCSYRMTHEGDYLGEIQFTRTRRFSEAQLAGLESLLGTLLYPLRNALLFREAVYSAHSDSLTGIGNRMALEQTLEREIRLATRHNQALSILLLDIDHFKSINDRFGHAYGDEVLMATVNCISQCLREVDGVFRLGGEEFVIVLGNTEHSPATLVAERIRLAIEQMQFEIDGVSLPVTASIGVATYRQPESRRELLERCDKLMYQAKRNGRNRTCA